MEKVKIEKTVNKSPRALHLAAVWLMVFAISSACALIPQPGQKPTDTPTATQPPPEVITITPTPTPTPTPAKPVVVVTPDSQVRRLKSAVFAGPAQPLPELTSDGSIDLEAGGLVTTDINGEAELTIQNCLKIFIFQDTTLQRKTCRKSDAASGAAVCSTGGVTGVLNNCTSQVSVQTPGSDVQTHGTWFAVIYLPEDHLSIIQVYQGEVNVRAVVDTLTGKTTSQQAIKEGSLWFTSPGADAPVIAGISGRDPQPMEVWEALRSELINKYPLLDKWMNAVKNQAAERRLAYPQFLSRPAGQVTVNLLGPAWTDNIVQKAILSGVDWAQTGLQAWPDLDITPSVVYNKQVVEDARQFSPDVRQAYAYLKEKGFFRNVVRITALDSDQPSLAYAGVLQGQLDQLGITSEIIPMGAADLKQAIDSAQAGKDPPLIWLAVSGDAFAIN
jgi:hypothetical protein